MEGTWLCLSSYP